MDGGGAAAGGAACRTKQSATAQQSEDVAAQLAKAMEQKSTLRCSWRSRSALAAAAVAERAGAEDRAVREAADTMAEGDRAVEGGTGGGLR